MAGKIDPALLKVALASVGVDVSEAEAQTFQNILSDVLSKHKVGAEALKAAQAHQSIVQQAIPVAPVAPVVGVGLKPSAKAKAKQTTWPGLPVVPVAPVVTVPGAPITQKANGILALVKAGLLAKGMAHVALSVEQAVKAYQSLSGPVFVRPCPEVPRHGFVDSRVCSSVEEVRGVFAEAKKADPKAELILMPYIAASHNMVWTPGLLAVGPGHDGATAGKACLSLTVNDTMCADMATLSKLAKVGADSDPYIEAVSSSSHELVITQVRGGPKGAPKSPDWNPWPGYLVTDVIVAEGDLLEWEGTAVALGQAITYENGVGVAGPAVWHPGGSLTSHFGVHCRLSQNMVPVYTTVQPQVGQTLDAVGQKLDPLDPEAVVWGFLGGLAAPNLLPTVNRAKAVACALSGAHHGLNMGGQAGVGLGVSVAMMLRLGQAALWGEARHKEHKGLSREQVYASVLNDWTVGRSKLGEKTTLFHTASWGSSFGGKAWAACGHATIDLDAAMLALIQDPTVAKAEAVVVKLNTVINLAHNNGWWLNKFGGTTQLFDQGAAGDPRPLLLAAPVWYEAALVPADVRMGLLERLQDMAPVVVSHKAPVGKMATPKAPKALKVDGVPHVEVVSHTIAEGNTGKIGNFGTMAQGLMVTLPHAPKSVQAKGSHVQVMTTHGYLSGEVVGLLPVGDVTVASLSGSGADYTALLLEKASESNDGVAWMVKDGGVPVMMINMVKGGL